MKEFLVSVEYVETCPKCKSNKIKNRFDEPEDTEDYHYHYDTLKCSDCGFWDFPSAFSDFNFEKDGRELCPKCKTIGDVRLYMVDVFSGEVTLRCNKCNHDDLLQEFVPEELRIK